MKVYYGNLKYLSINFLKMMLLAFIVEFLSNHYYHYHKIMVSFMFSLITVKYFSINFLKMMLLAFIVEFLSNHYYHYHKIMVSFMFSLIAGKFLAIFGTYVP